ncbi:hypothetical protein CMUS01_09847 [Colletotrichum musicola]|uniref:Uncharacterized protein n=1 Tax=Colletotrichum musicola TaxID=2175873 RepID=A0A8H6K621_9PEZI|nr:hypothetical protein CMUS01_09847 [Colletotrichum musicola]
MSANISSIVFDLRSRSGVYNSTPGFMWPEILYGIYPRTFSDPQTVTVPLIQNYTNASRDCGGPWMLYYAGNAYNCAALSIAATLAQKHNFSLDHPSVREAGQNLKFEDLLSFNATGILEQIVGCASNSCGGPGMTTDQTKLLGKEYGKCGEGIGDLSPSNVNGNDLNVILGPLKGLCSLAPRDVEADIAGPGIIVSYILQLSLCAWFFIFGTIIPREPSHSFFLWWVRVKRWLWRRVRKRKQPEEVRPRSMLSRLRSSRFSAALFSAIIEFQETQLFLTLALQLATMFMRVVNEELTTQMDLRAARTIVSGGALMVLLTQTITQRRGMHWWYTLTMTVIVGALGIAIQFLIPLTKELAALPGESECGKYTASILSLCPGGGLGLRFTNDYAPYPIFYAVATFALIADQLRHAPWAVSKLDVLRAKSDRLRVFFLKSSYVVWNLGWFVLNFFMFFLLILNAIYVFEEVGDALDEMEKWTFGQVVAVLPWAPVVSKYIYYNIFGLENGVGNRIDHHYKVVRDESRPGTDQKQSDTRSLVGDEYISLQNVEGDSRRTSDPEATGWGRASPAGEGPDGDLGSCVSRTSHL